MFLVVVLLSLVGTTLTSSLSKRGGHSTALINCPTCEHHVCDVNNLMQCEVCQVVVPHKDQPPQNVKCVHAGHCNEDHHNYCCENEGCVESFFGSLGSGASTNTPVIQTAAFMGCPSCHGESCDFNNRIQCSVCKIDLHDGHLPHTHCLKENEHCDPNHHICCSDEPCIAQAFGHLYPTSRSTITTTKSTTSTVHSLSSESVNTGPTQSSALSTTTTVRPTKTSPQTSPTSTDGHTTHPTNQPNYIPCPICAHNTCDPGNSILCEVCQIAFDHSQRPHEAKCTRMEHCHDNNDHICCTDMACVESVFGKFPKSVYSPKGEIFCPNCHKNSCTFISCETCVYHHHDPLPQFKTCELKHECRHDDVICCHDYHCIDELFGTHYQSTVPPTQSTANQSLTSKPTMTASTSNSQTTANTTTIQLATTLLQNVGTSTHNTNGTNAPITSTKSTTTTTNAQSTATGTTTSNGHQPTHHVSSDATSINTMSQQSAAPTTTASSPNGTNNSCHDEQNINCFMFKNMGVCHASPQEGTKYEIAFRCKQTCDRCNETYQPLTTVASTIATTIGATKAPMHCQVCGDYDNNIPCDLVSVYKGTSVACTDGAYCMNDIIHEQGNVRTFKRCVNETVCRNLWMSQTSDQDHCTNYGNVMVGGDYSCHYCCTSDDCNRGLIPDPSTLYIKA